ncbi:unnamed protein product [Amoebophrya sp. A120]|nr:unnamed protein product [Amoebophrya sp. A120]|eukprot:GSA120T00025159001.1
MARSGKGPGRPRSKGRPTAEQKRDRERRAAKKDRSATSDAGKKTPMKVKGAQATTAMKKVMKAVVMKMSPGVKAATAKETLAKAIKRGADEVKKAAKQVTAPAKETMKKTATKVTAAMKTAGTKISAPAIAAIKNTATKVTTAMKAAARQVTAPTTAAKIQNGIVAVSEQSGGAKSTSMKKSTSTSKGSTDKAISKKRNQSATGSNDNHGIEAKELGDDDLEAQTGADTNITCSAYHLAIAAIAVFIVGAGAMYVATFSATDNVRPGKGNGAEAAARQNFQVPKANKEVSRWLDAKPEDGADEHEELSYVNNAVQPYKVRVCNDSAVGFCFIFLDRNLNFAFCCDCDQKI